jgi:hypothetical protein
MCWFPSTFCKSMSEKCQSISYILHTNVHVLISKKKNVRQYKMYISYIIHVHVLISKKKNVKTVEWYMYVYHTFCIHVPDIQNVLSDIFLTRKSTHVHFYIYICTMYAMHMCINIWLENTCINILNCTRYISHLHCRIDLQVQNKKPWLPLASAFFSVIMHHTKTYKIMDQLRCHDRVAVGFPTTCAINAYHH